MKIDWLEEKARVGLQLNRRLGLVWAKEWEVEGSTDLDYLVED